MKITDQILDYLRIHPEANFEEIANAISASTDTVKRTVYRLKKREDIEQVEDESGARKWVVHKQPKGTPGLYKKDILTEMCELFLEDFRAADIYSERVEIGKMICRILEKI